ncbi:unnamed protein product, partial [Mesorhabditis belari]|uniref:FIP-RBD domain-containing protein n=1 Tax=Mesorhabditis belari TaxID=2138241 RepID=A0AAF3FHW8_9BILA
MTEVFEALAGDDDSGVGSMRVPGSGGFGGVTGGGSASSTQVASRLYNGRHNGESRRDSGSFGSDPELITFSDSDDITTQVSTISKRLNEMEENHSLTNEERNRLKLENAVLNERYHALEEDLIATEQRYKEKLDEERARTKDLMGRLEREKQLENESAQLKYQVLEKDFLQLKKEREKFADENRHLKENNEKLKDEVAEANLLAEDLENERIKLEREYKRFQQETQHEIDSSSEMVEELSRQTEELRSRASMPRQGSIAEQMVSLEDEVARLRAECRELKKNNEELQTQMLQESVERGRSLLEDGMGVSLAEELNGKDTTELVNALREQEICNQKLRVYINGILMRVIETHPEILEQRKEHSMES